MLFSASSTDLVLFCFFILFYCGFLFLFKSSSLLFLLILMETSWISLYLTSLVSAFIFDYLLCLAFGFFFLMFSAAEISTGLALFLYLTRTTNSLLLDFRRLNYRPGYLLMDLSAVSFCLFLAFQTLIDFLLSEVACIQCAKFDDLVIYFLTEPTVLTINAYQLIIFGLFFLLA